MPFGVNILFFIITHFSNHHSFLEYIIITDYIKKLKYFSYIMILLYKMSKNNNKTFNPNFEIFENIENNITFREKPSFENNITFRAKTNFENNITFREKPSFENNITFREKPRKNNQNLENIESLFMQFIFL